uniref:Lipocalin n=1 Tax=Rhipicephalus appendiculatus TaxID=34631 RepID=A0A131Z8K7_RHIAP
MCVVLSIAVALLFFSAETQCNQSDKQQNSDTEVLDVEASTDSALPNKFREFWGQNICALRLRTTNAGVTPCTWLRLEHCNISGVTLSECIYLREKKYGRPVNLRKPWNFVGNDSMMAKDADGNRFRNFHEKEYSINNFWRKEGGTCASWGTSRQSRGHSQLAQSHASEENFTRPPSFAVPAFSTVYHG